MVVVSLLIALGGEINTSQGVLSASSESSENGGIIRLTATGNITTADVNVFTETGDAGNITINSSEGNIDTTAGTLRAGSNLETGGFIDLTAGGKS